MGINSISGPSGVYPSSNDFYLQNTYKQEYISFIKNPTPQQGELFLNFLQNNEAGLTNLANQIGYQPSKGASWSGNLHGLVSGLEHFINGNSGSLAPIMEFAGQCATWIGIGQTPKDILNAVEIMIHSFIAKPTHHGALGLDWILNTPGYINALVACSNHKEATLEALAGVQQDLILYQEDPSNPTYTQELIYGLREFESTLKSNLT